MTCDGAAPTTDFAGLRCTSHGAGGVRGDRRGAKSAADAGDHVTGLAGPRPDVRGPGRV